MPRPKIFTEQDKVFLFENHKVMTVPNMAKELKKSATTVYDKMSELGLTPKGRVIPREHPFRVNNRRLEALLIECKKSKRV
jgi:hypothetical protein